MSYQVIARKYRPQTFADIAGQAVSVRTLQNAIRRNRTSHAYLFSGPRGVGKTTMARILAKALNCHQGPTPEPCLQCPSCTEIAQGNAIDVIEIDAASNNSVDDIRELRDGIPYGPARDRYKIFIMDEAHMLSAGAFNALLKTLEEPPAHAVFILATTEKQKLPDTILSRCQPFDFQLISTAEIAARVRAIVKAEDLAISDRAIEHISIAGEGSLRDALSLLDQVISYGGAKLSDEDVAAILGEIDFSVLERLTSAIADSDAERVLWVVGEVCDTGGDLQHFCRRLLQHFRNLLVSRTAGGNARLLNLPESQIPQLTRLAGRFSQEDLLRCLEILSRTEGEMRWAHFPRFYLELALLKLCYVPRLYPLSEMIRIFHPGGKGIGEQAATSGPSGGATQAASPLKPLPAAPHGGDSGAAPGGVELFRKTVKEQRLFLDSWLDAASSIRFANGQLQILFSRKFSIQRDKVLEPENLDFLKRACIEVFGTESRLAVALEGDNIPAIDPAVKPPASQQQAAGELLDRFREDPVVRSFLDTFPGKVTVEEE